MHILWFLIPIIAIFLPSMSSYLLRQCKSPINRIFPGLRASSSSSFIRLERILSNRGLGSRSEVSKLIQQGKVRIAGKIIRDSSSKHPSDIVVEVDGQLSSEVGAYLHDSYVNLIAYLYL
jgi:hypothetical protein